MSSIRQEILGKKTERARFVYTPWPENRTPFFGRVLIGHQNYFQNTFLGTFPRIIGAMILFMTTVRWVTYPYVSSRGRSKWA
jgi:hypothetical protein